MGNQLLISIILPVYNGEKFLSYAIQSCLNQSYINFELIIVNDASTDRSLEIAKEFEKKDKRIRILNNEENLKLPASLNRGHRFAAGQFLTWTSDDNILKSNFLSSLIKKMYAEKNDLVFSDFDIIWEDGKLKRRHKSGPVEALIFGDTIGASFLYSREVFEKLGGYNEDLFLVEDYDFFLRASLHFKIGYLNQSLFKYRLHEKSLTSKISGINSYKSKHKSALQKMYENLQKEIGISHTTIKNLINLYFQEPISLNTFLSERKLIKEDILKYLKAIRNQVDLNVSILQNRIFWNWYANSEDHTVQKFCEVVIKDKSILFNEYSNINAVIRMALKCLFPVKISK